MYSKWDFYFARVNDKLASLFVDLGIRNSAPDPQRTQLVWCWVYMNSPSEDGLSEANEAPMLVSIENDLQRSLADQATFVGRITTAGRREFYFYAEDASPCKDVVSQAMSRYAAYRFEVGSNRDERWSQYLDLLYPSPEDFRRIENRHAIEVLENQGDEPSKSRRVSHWAYFGSEAARSAFIAEILARGFTIGDYPISATQPSQHPLGVSFDSVNTIDQIDDVTVELFRLARLHGGVYDGWETSLEKAL